MYTNEKNLTGILLALHCFRAFDSLSKSFVIKALEKFKFGPMFIHWIKCFTNRNQSCISNHGWLNGWFNIERGVRQGCPLSSLLFITALEIFSCNLRNRDKIKGITLPKSNEQLKLSQYADDMTIFVQDIQSFYLTLQMVENFAQVTGLKINMDKSKGMSIGKWKYKNKSLGGLNFCQSVKILGVWFQNNLSASLVKKNWEHLENKIEALIEKWSKRSLTIIGKILVVKSLILSQMIHMLMAFKAPEEFFSKINTGLFQFIWANNAKKRKRKGKPQSTDSKL